MVETAGESFACPRDNHLPTCEVPAGLRADDDLGADAAGDACAEASGGGAGRWGRERAGGGKCWEGGGGGGAGGRGRRGAREEKGDDVKAHEVEAKETEDDVENDEEKAREERRRSTSAASSSSAFTNATTYTTPTATVPCSPCLATPRSRLVWRAKALTPRMLLPSLGPYSRRPRHRLFQ